MSNLSRLFSQFKTKFPDEYKNKVDDIEKFIVNYIKKNELNIKFLNSCSTGFAGVRTRDQIIICSPFQMATIGDFLYTIFHEIRHEQQVRDIKMKNPFQDYDLNDFEKLYEQYWEMELDSDQFAKNMVAKIVIKLGLPLDLAKKHFGLSQYIEQYPTMSQIIKNQVRLIVQSIMDIKKSGEEYVDIQDHPMVKRHLDKLENFI
jgi:hypothetical protein